MSLRDVYSLEWIRFLSRIMSAGDVVPRYEFFDNLRRLGYIHADLMKMQIARPIGN